MNRLKGFKVKILLADDHGLFRDSMAVWLQQYSDDIDIVFASDWASLEQSLDDSVQLVMMDLNMPGMQGAASIQLIRNARPLVPVLVVSANDEQQTIQTCLKAGANGYITKASEGPEILKAVATVLDGKQYCPKLSHPNEEALFINSLSKRQIQLLSHLAQGQSNRDIAHSMHLSEGTVKQYVSQILNILEVDNRTQAGNKARSLLGIDDQ